MPGVVGWVQRCERQGAVSNKITLMTLVAQLDYWLQTNCIDPKELTLIFNFASARDGARIDALINYELKPFMRCTGSVPAKFQLMGIQIKVESPVHQ